MSKDKFLTELLGDVVRSLKAQETDDGQFARRNLVRTTFAAIDGISWLYREHIVEVLRDLELLDPIEESALSDEFHTFNEAGKVSTQRRYLSVFATIKLATRLAKRADPSLSIDFGDGGWEKLREAVNVRNRITHPKQPTDMNVQSNDIADCLVGFYWLLESATNAMEASTGALRLHADAARDLVELLQAGDPGAWAQYLALSKINRD